MHRLQTALVAITIKKGFAKTIFSVVSKLYVSTEQIRLRSIFIVIFAITLQALSKSAITIWTITM